MTRTISHLAEIIDRFDGLLVDQYGVLHDGRSAFAGTQDCMESVFQRDMPIVAVSNSGKRAQYNLDRLEALGFPAAWFRGMVTSGELTFRHLTARLERGDLREGDPVAVLARDDPGNCLSGLPLRAVEVEDDPKLLLIAGAEPEHFTREAYRARLRPLAAKGIPAICSNPDLQIYVDGSVGFGSGCLARDFAAMGGAVVTLGKPGAEMFRAALALLGDPDPARVLMIGDSPEHDIAGAQAVGCATLLISGGVQAGEGDGSSVPDFTIPGLR